VGNAKTCYDISAVGTPGRREVNLVEIINAFVVSVMAGIVSYFICKWLEGDE